MIRPEDLVDGLYVKTEKGRGNLHKEFTIWSVKSYWVRFKPGFGQIMGTMNKENMLNFLNKHNFQIIGRCEFKFLNNTATPLGQDSFNITGAL